MPTDDERRRVAAALRYYASSDIDGGLLPSLKDAAEVAGGTWGTLFTRLADLIEPAPKCSEATPKCDRDALLALADKMASFSRDSSCPSCAASGQPECSCGVECRESISHSAARRIREACGEAR